MLTLIQHGEVYTPQSIGRASVLIGGSKIIKIGNIDSRVLLALSEDAEIIDASDCYVVPGLIDPHSHLIGAGGEQGFGSRMPEIQFEQLVAAGITTVVGLLGTDVSGRSLRGLLAKVYEVNKQGITAYMYTGGFPVPPSTLTGSVTDDLTMLAPIIGLGEIAISDERSSQPSVDDLAKLVAQAKIGGLISGKAGITHFHIGEGKERLSQLHKILDSYDLEPHYFYVTHITRTREVMDDALKLVQRGAWVDMDTVEENIGEWLPYYLTNGGIPERLTISSDAHTPGGSPARFYNEFCKLILEGILPLEQVLPFFTSNTAEVLKLNSKGRLEAGVDADVLVLRKTTLEIRHVFAHGKQLSKEKTE